MPARKKAASVTWGDCLDYQMRIWKRMPSAKTNAINAGHITALYGRGMPIEQMGKVIWWVNTQQSLLDKGKAGSTVNRIMSAASHTMRQALEAELHDIPVPKFKRLREIEGRHTWFKPTDVDALSAAAVEIYDNQDLADIVTFAAYTGMRATELLKLRYDDVDLSTKTVWVGGKPHLVPKGKKPRPITYDNHRVVDILERRQGSVLLFGDVFRSSDALDWHWQKLRDYCGFSKDHCFHSLRHSYATWLAEQGVPVRTIQRLMGHRCIETTMRYVKATEKSMRDAAAALNFD